MTLPQITPSESFTLDALLDCYGKTRFNKEFYTEVPTYQKRMREIKSWIKREEITINRENYSDLFRLLDKRFRNAEL